MAVDTYSLITLTELQQYPGIPTSPTADEQTMLEKLIDGTSYAIEAYVKNAIVQRSFTEDYTWESISRKQTQYHNNRISLLHYPIVSVTSITDPAGNTVPATDYWIDKPRGFLTRSGSWRVPQDSNGWASYWTIIYTAGRYASTAVVIADIKLACKMQVAHVYDNPDQDVRLSQVGDLRLVFAEGKLGEASFGLIEQVRSMLAPYKQRII